MLARLDVQAGGCAIIYLLLMLKQKVKNSVRIRHFLGLLVVGVTLSTSVFVSAVVRADPFDEQIRTLQQDSVAKKQISDQLAAQATSYQNAIDILSTQINSIRQLILDYQRQSSVLQQQIEVQQAELVRQKQVLGQNIKAMYLEGQISTLEILASSKDLSEFVDKQQYRNSVQTKVKTTVDKITELKLQLEVKQREIKGLINDQQAQQAQLDVSLGQQSDLLNLTASQKAAKDAEIKANKNKISALQAAQAAVDRLLGQSNGGNLVSQGWVSTGEQIGRMGSTGYSTGPHVHFAAKNANGTYVDPLAAGYGWPTPNSDDSRISQPFGCTDFPGEPRDPSCATGLTHQGVDIWGSAGDPVVAAASGDIIFNNCSSGLGWLVIIRQSNGWVTMYAHMKTPSGQIYGYC